MAVTATVPSAASVGAFSSEIATAQAARGDYDPAVANALRTFATQVVADLTAMDTELTGIPAPTAAAKILYDNGTAYVETAAGTAAQVPVINAGATAPVFVTLSGDASISSAGVVTVAKVNGASYGAGGALTTGTIPRVTGAAAVAYGALDLANASAVTGVLPSANVSTLFTVGTALTDTASTTVQRAATRTSFLLAGTMSQGETITLGTTGAVAGDLIKIIRTSTSAQTAAIVNGGVGAGTLFTMQASKAGFVVAQFDGTNWLFDMGGTE